jgi:hypothetical protein
MIKKTQLGLINRQISGACSLFFGFVSVCQTVTTLRVIIFTLSVDLYIKVSTKNIHRGNIMKILITISLALISLNSLAGIHLTCDQSIIDQSGYSDSMNGVKSISILNCYDNNREQYTLFMKGFGVGGKLALMSEYAVTCPTVSKRRLNRKGKVVLGSVKANASVFVGADVAVAANHRGGVCLLAGYDFYGVAAAVSVGKMVIYKGSVHHPNVNKDLKKYLPTHSY